MTYGFLENQEARGRLESGTELSREWDGESKAKVTAKAADQYSAGSEGGGGAAADARAGPKRRSKPS